MCVSEGLGTSCTLQSESLENVSLFLDLSFSTATNNNARFGEGNKIITAYLYDLQEPMLNKDPCDGVFSPSLSFTALGAIKTLDFLTIIRIFMKVVVISGN